MAFFMYNHPVYDFDFSIKKQLHAVALFVFVVLAIVIGLPMPTSLARTIDVIGAVIIGYCSSLIIAVLLLSVYYWVRSLLQSLL